MSQENVPIKSPLSGGLKKIPNFNKVMDHLTKHSAYVMDEGVTIIRAPVSSGENRVAGYNYYAIDTRPMWRSLNEAKATYNAFSINAHATIEIKSIFNRKKQKSNPAFGDLLLTRKFLAKVFFISGPYHHYLNSIQNQQTLNSIKLRIAKYNFFLMPKLPDLLDTAQYAYVLTTQQSWELIWVYNYKNNYTNITINESFKKELETIGVMQTINECMKNFETDSRPINLKDKITEAQLEAILILSACYKDHPVNISENTLESIKQESILNRKILFSEQPIQLVTYGRKLADVKSSSNEEPFETHVLIQNYAGVPLSRKSLENLNGREKMNLASQLCHAVYSFQQPTMFGPSLVHCDLRYTNVLINRENSPQKIVTTSKINQKGVEKIPQEVLRVYLIDPGIAVEHIDGKPTQSRIVGDERFPLEMRRRPSMVEPKSDVWMLGKLLWEILAVSSNFYQESTLSKEIMVFPGILPGIDIKALVKDFISRDMRADNTKDRPTIAQCTVFFDAIRVLMEIQEKNAIKPYANTILANYAKILLLTEKLWDQRIGIKKIEAYDEKLKKSVTKCSVIKTFADYDFEANPEVSEAIVILGKLKLLNARIARELVQESIDSRNLAKEIIDISNSTETIQEMLKKLRNVIRRATKVVHIFFERVKSLPSLIDSITLAFGEESETESESEYEYGTEDCLSSLLSLYPAGPKNSNTTYSKLLMSQTSNSKRAIKFHASDEEELQEKKSRTCCPLLHPPSSSNSDSLSSQPGDEDTSSLVIR